MRIRVTIITVCYNAGDSLKETIRSVLKQTFKEYEYLIIDGKSSDRSMDIIQEYKNDKMKIYSEEELKENIYIFSTPVILFFLNQYWKM